MGSLGQWSLSGGAEVFSSSMNVQRLRSPRPPQGAPELRSSELLTAADRLSEEAFKWSETREKCPTSFKFVKNQVGKDENNLLVST